MKRKYIGLILLIVSLFVSGNVKAVGGGGHSISADDGCNYSYDNKLNSGYLDGEIVISGEKATAYIYNIKQQVLKNRQITVRNKEYTNGNKEDIQNWSDIKSGITNCPKYMVVKWSNSFDVYAFNTDDEYESFKSSVGDDFTKYYLPASLVVPIEELPEDKMKEVEEELNSYKDKLDDLENRINAYNRENCKKEGTNDYSDCNQVAADLKAEAVDYLNTIRDLKKDFPVLNSVDLANDLELKAAQLMATADEYGKELERIANAGGGSSSQPLNPSDWGDDIATCEELIGPNVIEFIKSARNLIMVVGPIIALVLSAYELVLAVASGEDDAKKKAFKKVRGRVIAAVLLLIVPYIITLVLNIVNNQFGNCL